MCIVTGTDQVDWRPEHKGYALHVVSTAAEWVVALLFVASIVTYIPEMRVVSVRPPAFRVSRGRGSTSPAESFGAVFLTA